MKKNKEKMEKIRGHLIWFDKNRGFGFIKTNKDDYFLHYSNFRDADVDIEILKPDILLEFYPAENFRGKFAREVVIISDNDS